MLVCEGVLVRLGVCCCVLVCTGVFVCAVVFWCVLVCVGVHSHLFNLSALNCAGANRCLGSVL